MVNRSRLHLATRCHSSSYRFPSYSAADRLAWQWTASSPRPNMGRLPPCACEYTSRELHRCTTDFIIGRGETMHANYIFTVACNFSCFAWSIREAGSSHRLGFDQGHREEQVITDDTLLSCWRRNGFMTRQKLRLNRGRALDRPYTTWTRKYTASDPCSAGEGSGNMV
jgi:hypothetical protein